MGIFNKFSEKISQTSRDTIESAKNLAEIANFNSLIVEEEKKISNYYMLIGKKYYELNSQNETSMEFIELFTSVTEAMNKINEFTENIQRIKGIKKCPNCGVDIPWTHAFCGMCGFDTRSLIVNEKKIPHCHNCDSELPDDVLFCTNCGCKLDVG